MATPPRVGDGDDLDASLWSELQSFVDLSVIYAKLPLASFFRLRQVCKEWNRLASDRKFLERNFKPPISSNPYFILPRPTAAPHALLTCEGSSWSSTPVPRVQCEASGLLLLFEDSDRKRVFDLHTRVFHTLPPLPAIVPAPEELEDDPLALMIVDTSLIPYGFKVIVADEVIGTRIFDSISGAWTHKPSTLHPYMIPPNTICTSCAYHNKSLYIRVENYNTYFRGGPYVQIYDLEIQIYDLERDEWDWMELDKSWSAWDFSEFGMWQDRLFVLGIAVGGKNLVKVFEFEFFTNSKEARRHVYDHLPIDLHDWMRDSRGHLFMNKFCGEYMLMYNHIKGDEERVVLYNLDRKTWTKIELHTTSMLV